MYWTSGYVGNVHRQSRRLRAGFTMIEVAIAIVIVAIGVIAVQGLVASSTMVTLKTNELQTAGTLAQSLHERCIGIDRSALLVLSGTTFSPPVDNQGNAITTLPNFSQLIDVDYVDPKSITGTSPDETSLLRVSVTVSKNGEAVLTSSRLIATTKQE
jgi:prepilin-type N-terminal cleavage/methylation domain-containing protein